MTLTRITHINHPCNFSSELWTLSRKIKIFEIPLFLTKTNDIDKISAF